MKRMNRMLGRALASALACAALAGFVAAAVKDQDRAASKDSAIKTQPMSQTSSAVSETRDAQGVISAWPIHTKKAALAMIEKYGQPDAVSDQLLVWNDKAPWKQVAVFRDSAPHALPMPHEDFLENTINFKVPLDKVADLIKFDQALVIDETRGTLASHCDSEESNFLALNLANEIVTGKRDVASAQDFLKSTLTKSMAGKSSPYMHKLLFSPSISMDEGTPAEEKSESPSREREATPITPGTEPQRIPHQGY